MISKFSCPHCQKDILITIDKSNFVDFKESIVDIVSVATGVTKEKIFDIRNTQKSTVDARHISMYIMYEVKKFSMSEIRDYFKLSHHTTVMYGVNRLRDRVKHDNYLLSLVNKTITKLSIHKV